MRATKLQRHLFDALYDHLRSENKEKTIFVRIEVIRTDLAAGDAKREDQLISEMNLSVVKSEKRPYYVLTGKLLPASILRLSDELWIESIEMVPLWKEKDEN